jgi:SNF2 family DNA or RNA helicase
MIHYHAPTNTVLYPLNIRSSTLLGALEVGDRIAVPATLLNLQKLTRAGLPVVPPMRNYDWPAPAWIKPLKSQIATANFMALNPRSFVFSDMRTGKTFASLWAADYVMREYPGTKCLIVANLSTLRPTWSAAIFQLFGGKRTCAILHGSNLQRERALNQDVDFYIINHDGLGVGADTRRPWRGFSRRLLERDDIQLVIVDEASAYRNATTRRHKVAQKLFATRAFLWQMTGTPVSNGPMDAYGLKKLQSLNYYDSFRSLRDQIMTPITQFKWVPKPCAAEVVQKLLSPAIRFSQSDCFDLPPITTELRDAPLSPAQTKALKDLKREMSIVIGQGEITAVHEAALRQKFIQISAGVVYDADHATHVVDAPGRLGVLREILDEAPRKIIVFAPLTGVIDFLYKSLKDYSRVVLDGRTDEKERSKILQCFQSDPEPRILIAHPGPIARGLDLTAAATIVWYAPTDRTEDYLQANERINGPKQKHARHIVRIVSTPLEEEIFKRLATNEKMQGAILKATEI